jgi:anti-anti-sigma regulatory factor
MLRITRRSNGEVILTLSGRMDAENIGELRAALDAEGDARCMALDLKDLTLVDRDAVSFLAKCEAEKVAAIWNCPPYIREWMARERQASR